jgi:hypothetical protein
MRKILSRIGVIILSREEQLVARICCERMKKGMEKKQEPLEEIEKRALQRINSTLIKLS